MNPERELMFHGEQAECNEHGIRINASYSRLVGGRVRLDGRSYVIVQANHEPDGSAQLWVVRP